MEKVFTSKKLKTIILSVIIAIVLASFVIYLVESIYPSPDWEDYCGGVKAPRMAIEEKGDIVEVNQVTCEADGGTWRNNWCDYHYECENNFDEVRDKHRLTMFIVAAITGIIAIVAGIILALPSVSSGIMLGGGFLIFYGTAQYWDELSNWIRTIILGALLVILIWLGYKKLQN